MIFLGDVAHPFSEPPEWTNGHWPWSSQAVIANLEGSVVFENSKHLKHRKLFNHASVVDVLIAANVRAVSLANNHVMDVREALVNTTRMLSSQGIEFTGAGTNLTEAARPARIVDADRVYLLLGAGWVTIQCQPAGKDSPGVNPLSPYRLLAAIESWRKTEPNSVIVVLLHWNYEMELYPQPAHRQLAKAAIEVGADAVIGHHPHCVGGIEFHRGCPIVYSVGNWWLPQGVYFNGKLKFGEHSKIQLALEWRSKEDPVICHWFTYRTEGHALIYNGSELLDNCRRIRELTPYSGMNHSEYIKWFRCNRVKRRALPIYQNYTAVASNSLRDRYVRARHVGLTGLERLGLRKLLRL
ncbi:MAG: Capsule biosynthesis protein CapA [Syntrophorhabdus sp. PtaB.Bin006]|nr:MAG: Capsule biosynthesis protein CapA [Syntrophorhabdus sp. PtaB.Bin006]